MAAAVIGSPASAAGFGDPGVTYPWLYRKRVPFQLAGTSIFQVAPSGSVPFRLCAPLCTAAADRVAASAGAAAEPRPSASSPPARVNRVSFCILNTITLLCACLLRGPAEDCNPIYDDWDRFPFRSAQLTDGSRHCGALTAVPAAGQRGPVRAAMFRRQ